jgi:hypothetical protein
VQRRRLGRRLAAAGATLRDLSSNLLLHLARPALRLEFAGFRLRLFRRLFYLQHSAEKLHEKHHRDGDDPDVLENPLQHGRRNLTAATNHFFPSGCAIDDRICVSDCTFSIR